MNRRRFLASSLLAGAASAAAAPPAAAAPLPIGFNTYCLRAMKWNDLQLLDYAASLKLDAIFLRCDRSLRYESWSLDLPGSDHIPVFAEILGWGDL